MTPTLIGYFPKRTFRRTAGFSGCPPNVDEICNVTCASPDPEGWIDLWLHNAMWMYDTELQAWAVATDYANLKAIFRREGSAHEPVQRFLDEYILRHVMLRGKVPMELHSQHDWDIYAYRAFPIYFTEGRDEPFAFPPLNVQGLPGCYEHLGFDPVSRETGNTFSHSPLFCNGWAAKVKVNRFCLLDDPDETFRLARHFSDGKWLSPGSYLGPAEPGPYFVLEVLRRKVHAPPPNR